MRRILTASAVIGLAAALGLAAPAQAAPATNPAPATVGVFHGIPKTPVDVYVGAEKVLDDFQPGTFGGPLQLPAGRYLVRVTAADATSPAHPLLKERFQFSSGKNYSVIAHLTQKGKPALTKYVNDLRAAKDGGARVVVRHVAAAPAVQVLVNRKAATGALKNPQQATIKASAGTVDIKVRLAAKPRTTVLKADDVKLAPQTSTIVYAWGDAKKGTLQLTTRVVALKG